MKPSPRATLKLAAIIDDLNADKLHDYLWKHGYDSCDVDRISEPLRGKIYATFKRDPWKQQEIARLMDNPNS